LSTFVRSEASLSADVRGAAQGAGGTWQESLADYGRLLARLTTPERFPALTAVIASGIFDERDDPNAEYNFGIERLLDGIGLLIEQRATQRRRKRPVRQRPRTSP